MKILDDDLLLKPFDGSTEMERHLEQVVHMYCECGRTINFTEVIISRHMEQELKYTIKKINNSLKLIDDAIFECYGFDIRAKLLETKLKKIREEIFKPDIHVVK